MDSSRGRPLAPVTSREFTGAVGNSISTTIKVFRCHELVLVMKNIVSEGSAFVWLYSQADILANTSKTNGSLAFWLGLHIHLNKPISCLLTWIAYSPQAVGAGLWGGLSGAAAAPLVGARRGMEGGGRIGGALGLVKVALAYNFAFLLRVLAHLICYSSESRNTRR